MDSATFSFMNVRVPNGAAGKALLVSPPGGGPQIRVVVPEDAVEGNVIQVKYQGKTIPKEAAAILTRFRPGK